MSSPAAFTPFHSPEVQPEQWVPVNRGTFPAWIQKTFKYPHKDAKTNLFTHQRFVRDVLQSSGPNRGLLLYHGLGVGKTAASIAVADTLMGEGRDAIVMLPAFLHNNYVSEVMRYGSPLFRPHQRWAFTAYPNAKIEILERKFHLSKGYAKSAGGIWIPIDSTKHLFRSGSPVNTKAYEFTSLPTEQQDRVVEQIRAMIEGHYQFIHYNGLRRESITKLTQGNKVNPFSDKIVIIDEVHNFISRVVGGGLVAPAIYQLLLDAQRCKVLALSGTPCINHPHEVAVLMNLIRGPLVQHSLKFNIGTAGKKGARAFDEQAVDKIMHDSLYVDSHHVDATQKAIVFSLIPDDFEFVPSSNKGYVAKVSDGRSEADSVSELVSNLQKTAGIRISAAKGAIRREQLSLLPTDSDEFNKLFIDFDTNKVRNADMLARRLQGLVSFFRVYSPDLYPRVVETVVVECPMSKRQFEGYSEVREIERQSEDRSKKRQQRGSDGASKDIFKDTSNTYRCFSRAVCNFVFPKEVKRPYPSKISHTKGELDDVDLDEKAVSAMDDGADGQEGGAPASKKLDTSRAYQAALTSSLKQLKKGGSKWLGPTGLSALSPKFATIIDKLQACPGCALLYSTFRNVEGLGLMAMALDTYGWEELRVFKNHADGDWDMDACTPGKRRYMRFTGEREYAQIIMDIYNSEYERLPERIKQKVMATSSGSDRNLRGDVVRVMMITQSGSEGISLKNVRQVHIVEPYWNQVRLDQVMGRAVRAGSHLALPSDERSVESFVYLARFTAEQARAMRADNGSTSDDFIYGVAQRKSVITESVLGVVRASAVDAQLYTLAPAAKPSKRIQKAPKAVSAASAAAAYPDDISKDLKDADAAPQERRVVQITKTMTAATIKGVKYAYDAEEGVLYDYAATQEQPSRLVPVGQVEKTSAGKQRVRMFGAKS